MDNSFTFTGKFSGSTVLSGSGKTITLNNAAALTSGKSVSLGSNVTLSSPAANVTGKTLVIGVGAVNVTSLEDTIGCNLSLVTATTATATMTLSGNAEFTSSANLGDFVVTVGGTGTLTAHTIAYCPYFRNRKFFGR